MTLCDGRKDLSSLYNESVTIQHLFNNLLAGIVSKNVIAVDRRSLSDNNIDYVKFIGSLPSAPSPNTYTKSSEFTYNTWAADCMWANLLLLMRSEGFERIKLKGDHRSEILNKKIAEVLTDNDSIPCSFRSIKASEISLIYETFNSPVLATSAYSNISSIGMNNLTIIGHDGLYYVVGALISSSDDIRESLPDMNYISETQARTVIPSSNSDHLNSLLATTGSYVHHKEILKLIRPTLDIGKLTIAQVSRAPYVLADGPEIIAASILSSSDCTYAQGLWSWYLLDGYLRGKNLSDIRQLYNTDMDNFMSQSPRGKRAMLTGFKTYASSVRTYFYLNPVSASMDVDVSRYLELPPGSPSELNIPISFTVRNIVTLNILHMISLRGKMGEDDDIESFMFPDQPTIDRFNRILPLDTRIHSVARLDT